MSQVLNALVTIATGYTLGDAAVRLRYIGGRHPRWVARTLRFVGGIGGYQILGLVFDQEALWGGMFVLLSGVLLLTTRSGRGLPGILSGQRLDDARTVVPGSAPEDVVRAANEQEHQSDQ